MEQLAAQILHAQPPSGYARRFVHLSPEEYAALFETPLEHRLADRRLCARIRHELNEQGRLYRAKSGSEWVGRLSADVWEAVLGLVVH